MIIYRTQNGWELEHNGGRIPVPPQASGRLTTREDLHEYLSDLASTSNPGPNGHALMAPIEEQEIWAAGVTYFRSRTARMEESNASGGDSFYDRVYNAERPELFFKGAPHRAVGPGQPVRIRRDSKWNVPEPELTLLISPKGKIQGYTVGNDMSSRDIEGENPLYLPQAKVYDSSCALGPGILVSKDPLPSSTGIHLVIRRDGEVVFEDSTTLAAMKRNPEELVEYLYRESTFPNGCFLLTGTGIIPHNDFTLASGDQVSITVGGIGTLSNPVA